MNRDILHKLVSSEVLSYLDMHFANLMRTLDGSDNLGLLLAAALVSAATRQGHICLDLSQVAGKILLQTGDEAEAVQCPSLPDWYEKLCRSKVVGRPGDYRPLILDDQSRLYLYRYWDYQDKLVRLLEERINEEPGPLPIDALKTRLDGLFPASETSEPDWQKVAGFVAVRKKFAVISGGPGTGKTTTIAKILALLLEMTETGKRMRIALAAPTGKAAARLQEAIKKAKERLCCQESLKQVIPEDASTIHRLLGAVPGSAYFRHNERNLLPVDVVVVDEASMVDLALMSKLVQALSPRARLILLGDKDQLASVEAGAILGDICDTGQSHRYSRSFTEQLKMAAGYEPNSGSNQDRQTAIADCIVQLQKSYRFEAGSGIGVLSRAVNDGDGDSAVSLLKDDQQANIAWRRLPPPHALSGLIKDTVVAGFRGYLSCQDPLEVFKMFDRMRILCAVREGPFGVGALNKMVEKTLAEQKLIKPRKIWYAGRPVLIKTNNYNLGLFNGDVGITLPDRDSRDSLRVFFPAADGCFKKFHPLRLPDHETVFAMTVHKSQGSEFNDVLLILPDRDVPVLTRELIYTAITRAKARIEIWGNEDIFKTAVSRRIVRMSGLRDALWNS